MDMLSFRSVLRTFYKSTEKNTQPQRQSYQLGLGNGEDEDFSMFQVQQFRNLLSDKVIKEFLEFDHCNRLADKYLLAMVFAYFVRAKLPFSDYTRRNFFVALYLAHDIEEDDEDLKLCFVDWGLGVSHKKEFEYFISLRDMMWKAMDYRACVSLKTCHKIMESIKDCYLWKRERDPAHGGAVRNSKTVKEKCKKCELLDDSKRFYSSDCDDSSGESDSEEVSEYPSPPAKMARRNEE